tara:strand:+ start:1868 stop:2251 length:384 start_codon:yes stop_codon:yes gene_type:complete
MELTMGLLLFLGLFFTIFGLGMIKDMSIFPVLMGEMDKSVGHRLIFTFIPLIIGSGLLPFHFLWTTLEQQIVSIMLLLFLFIGIFRMLFLDSYHKVGLSLVQNKQSILIVSVLYLVIGLVLLYLGLR